MSSHHIVREHQEPAVLILSADSGDVESLGQLLEWSPVVVIHYQVIELALAMGIRVDAVASSPQQKKDVDTLMEYQLSFDWISIELTEDVLSLIKYIIRRKQGEAYLFVGADSDIFSLLSSLQHITDRIKLIVCNSKSKVSLYPPGYFNKFIQFNDQIQFFSSLEIESHYHSGGEEIKFKGLHQPMLTVGQFFECELGQKFWVVEKI